MLIILAVISVNLLLNGNIIGRAEQSKEVYQVAQIREELSLVLADAGVEKVVNKQYNENEFLDEFILKEEPDVKILDNIIIKYGHAFELDRSVPKLGEYVGEEKNLVFPDLELETEVADDCKTATITIHAKEEENGISKIEIIQAGFVIKEYLYDNEKGPITETFIVKQNGKYIVKVYSKLNVSKIIEVAGLVATVQYSPNGDETYQQKHSVKITADDGGDKVKSIKYQWLQTTAEPGANTFVYSCNNEDTITKDGLTGTWYLWTLLETENGKTNIGRSEAFYFDNEAPTGTVEVVPISETEFEISASIWDNHSGIKAYEVIVGTESYGVKEFSSTSFNYLVTVGQMGYYDGSLKIYDSAGCETSLPFKARTKLWAWQRYRCKVVDVVHKVSGPTRTTITDWASSPEHWTVTYSKEIFDLENNPLWYECNGNSYKVTTGPWITTIYSDNLYYTNLKFIKQGYDSGLSCTTMIYEADMYEGKTVRTYFKTEEVIGTILDSNPDTYPVDGEKSGVWYERQENLM